MSEEKKILEELKAGQEKAFTFLFKKYYKDLVLFSSNFLHDKLRCEDIVQNVFFKLWNDRETLEIQSSLKSYLLRSVQNACLDDIRHNQIVREHQQFTYYYGNEGSLDTENYILFSDLQNAIDDAIMKLPEQFREAFQMNRNEGLKYREIAQKLNVSERTVEVRIGKALSILREYLSDFFIFIISILLIK